MKLSREQDMVKTLEKVENGCMSMHCGVQVVI